jgi:hypothetical protein
MVKRKAGLHKEISSIFDGVPLGHKDRVPDIPAGPAPQRPAGGIPAKFDKSTAKTPLPPKAVVISPRTPNFVKEPQPMGQPQAAPKAATMPKVQAAVVNEQPGALNQVIQHIKEKLFVPKPGVDGRKQKIMVILIPVLLIIMVIAFAKVLTPSVRGKETPTKDDLKQNPAAGKEIQWTKPEPYPATLRDPMVMVAQITSTSNGSSVSEQVSVKGTLMGEGKPLAIIGSKILSEGDTINGAIIIKINKSSVEFEKDGKRWTQKVE